MCKVAFSYNWRGLLNRKIRRASTDTCSNSTEKRRLKACIESDLVTLCNALGQARLNGAIGFK